MLNNTQICDKHLFGQVSTHVQVVINCWYSDAQICTREDTLAHYLGMANIDNVMRYDTQITTVNIWNADFWKVGFQMVWL